MKKTIATVLLLSIFCFAAMAQDNITVCHTPATEKFALFASNKAFNREHPTPKPYVHTSQAGGKMIQYKCGDGQDANAYVLMNKKKTDQWVFVFQEWWGLNDHIKREAEKLFSDLGNVNVMALDLYDGKVTADRETAAQYMQAFKQERGDAIVKGALQHAGGNAKIATIGWCFGGSQSLQAAITAGKQANACVIYYGMPVEDVEKLKTLNTDVLGIFATKEKFITAEVVNKFEQNMKLANKNLTVKRYEAVHGFANPSNPDFDKAATEDAYKNTLAFFRERMK